MINSNLLLPIIAIYFLYNIQYSNSYKIHKIPRKKINSFQVEDEFINANIVKTQQDMQLKLSNRLVKLLNVPDVMQATQYTCGPSSLSAVLNYYQLVYREAQLAQLAKTDQEHGTGPLNLLAAIRLLNISAELKQGMLISDLENSIMRGRPIIVQIQAWGDEGTNYTNDFDDGHYVVVIGFDENYLYFEDPWIIGNIAYIPKKQFLIRWHDQVFSERRRVFNLGIIVNAPLKKIPVAIKLQ